MSDIKSKVRVDWLNVFVWLGVIPTISIFFWYGIYKLMILIIK
jgi:hypothetical protein